MGISHGHSLQSCRFSETLHEVLKHVWELSCTRLSHSGTALSPCALHVNAPQSLSVRECGHWLQRSLASRRPLCHFGLARDVWQHHIWWFPLWSTGGKSPWQHTDLLWSCCMWCSNGDEPIFIREPTDQFWMVRHKQVIFVQVCKELYWVFCTHIPNQFS